MSSIHETAYPRFKPNLTESELTEIYTPSIDELSFAQGRVCRSADRLAFLVLLKTGQRLGYFVSLSDVPDDIVAHIAKCADIVNFGKRKLKRLVYTGAAPRLRDLARNYLNITPFTGGSENDISEIAENAAQTKQEIADIINVILEELVRRRVELPGFTTLQRAARRARTSVNDRLYLALHTELTMTTCTALDALLDVGNDIAKSQWQKLKREPRKPTNKEFRNYLPHISWLKSWVDCLPKMDHIPTPKWRQLVLEARALDAAELKRVKPAKRYALTIALIHSQLHRAMDDSVTILTRKISSLHNKANQQLHNYHLERSQKVEILISQFRDVLHAYSANDSEEGKLAAIGAAFREDPEKLTKACDEHMAYAGNNYIPFMLPIYRSQRPLLLNCLQLLCVQSSSSDQSVLKTIQFVFKNRHKHKIELNIEEDELDLSWISDRWRKVITGTASRNTPVKKVHRLYLELCVLSQVVSELKSGDLFVENSEHYNDYRDQLISWDEYKDQIEEYGELVGIPSNPKEFVASLKDELSETASRIDRQFPNNELVDINDDGLVIRKHEKNAQPEGLEEIDNLITDRIPKISILDVLVETEDWLNLHKRFGPVSGFESKVDNPRKRFITTLFCYGCNLGPVQTARSVKELSRKQVAWLNLKHVTEARLEKATERVINAYNKFLLPKHWGSGEKVSADGTKWNMYEQNLLSEYHIRYGGYGGIGYYHVSDMYIALFSHFIPCGVYEAVHILDGLIKNESDIQPDTIHGDTQAQNAPVFGLSYLLGINLMPRIRGLKKLVFFRPERTTRYHHIDSLFSETINWQLIETHFPDMLRIVISIKAGKISPSTILRRLGTCSRKNKLYFAFRELGRAVRTIFLLKYIGDVEIRKTVHSATNKSEEFNNFIQWALFGSKGIISDNIRHEQRKIIKYNHLVANLVILHNVNTMSSVLKELKDEGKNITPEILAALSPYRTHHINRFGDYTLNLEREISPMNSSIRIL